MSPEVLNENETFVSSLLPELDMAISAGSDKKTWPTNTLEIKVSRV